MVSVNNFWNEWKGNFTQWLDSHYKLSWEMSPGEWTQGVMYPYLLYIARDKLGLWIRFAQEGRSGAVLYDENAETEVAHIEHENERDGVNDKLQGLYASKPNLKIVITYGDPKGGEPDVNRRENRELIHSWNDTLIRPALVKALSQQTEQEWLFIIGLEYDFRGESDWMAYHYSTAGGKVSVVELE